MGNAFVAGLKNEAPRGRDITMTEIPKLVKEAPSVVPKGPSLVTGPLHELTACPTTWWKRSRSLKQFQEKAGQNCKECRG